MGKKKRKSKRSTDEVIVIDLNDEDNSSGELDDHNRRSPRSKTDNGNASDLNTRKRDRDCRAESHDDGDCIDLTEQDTGVKQNDDSSEEIVLIDDDDNDDDGKSKNKKRRKFPAYAEYRQGLGLTLEKLIMDANDEAGTSNRNAKSKKQRSRDGDEGRNWKNDDGSWRKQRSPGRQDWNNGAKERQGCSHRSPQRQIGKGKASEYRKDLRQSPRKHGRDINYSDSPDSHAKEEFTSTRQSPRKRKNSSSAKEKEAVVESSDRIDRNDRSTSPLNKKPERTDKNGDFGERITSKSNGTRMRFQKGQGRWEKVPVNENTGLDRNSNRPEHTHYDRDKSKNIGGRVVTADDNTDGSVISSNSLSPAAISVKSGALLVLPHPSCFILKGKARVQPLVGLVCIMGHNLKDTCNSKNYDVYSPECNSLVTMETVTGETDKDAIMAAISSHATDTNETEYLQRKIKGFDSSVVLKVSRLDSALCDYVTTLTEYQNLFSMGGNKSDTVNKVLSPLGVAVFQDTWQPVVVVTRELQQAIDDWTESLNKPSKVQPCMMVVGGKDSGKSTINRLLINHTLNSIGGVYVLECDVGQTEFTPPGCISLHYITLPVLGPPFTHQRKPVCCYFYGGVTPQDDPSIYIDCVQRCVQKYQQLGEPGPLIVNTMGWVKGLGLQLLVDTMRMLSPSHIIQLWCKQKHHNCDQIDDQFHLQTSWRDLTKENSWREPEATDSLPSTRRTHKLMVVDSVTKSESVDLSGISVRLRPVDFRNLSLLSHLFNNLDPNMTLTSSAPYVIPWRCVAIHVCYMPVPRDQIMYSLNASVVALCHSDLEQVERPTEDSPMFFNKMPICDLIGFGIVRGVDPVKKELYIVTSLNLSSLKHVNTLLKGSVTLPEQLLMKQHCHGDRLYVDDEVKSIGLATVKPRKHMPRQRLQLNN